MAVRSLDAPVGRSRRSKYKFTTKEIDDAVKLLGDGKTPGVGPFETVKEARSHAAALLRECATKVADGVELGTKAWDNGDGDCFGIVRVK